MNKNAKGLKILVYGEPYDWAMAHNIVEACADLGIEAQIFDFTRFQYRTRRVSVANRILDRLLFHQVAKKINDDLVETLKKARFDALLVLKGIHVFPETLVTAKEHVQHVVNWNPDDFFNPLNSSRYLRASFSKYDCIFTPRTHLSEEYRHKGAKDVKMLHWYYLPKIQHPVAVTDEERLRYGSDLVFVGTWSRRREYFLSSLIGEGIRVWGGYWERADKSFRSRIECNPPVFGVEMSKIICSSKININILTAENRDTTNIRTFEIPACGGFQLSERSREIAQLFQEGEEIALYSTPDELRNVARQYLENEPARESVRLQGYKRLIGGHHTMRDRVATIVSRLNEGQCHGGK